jgi:hypothetical protein
MQQKVVEEGSEGNLLLLAPCRRFQPSLCKCSARFHGRIKIRERNEERAVKAKSLLAPSRSSAGIQHCANGGHASMGASRFVSAKAREGR